MADVQFSVKSDRPVVELGPPAMGSVHPLSKEEQEAIAGSTFDEKPAKKMGEDITVGGVIPAHAKIWYVNLDEDGKPTGDLQPLPPEDPDQPFISVTNAVPVEPSVLMTSSGAALTDQMNPEHSHYDRGLTERNPPPPPAFDPKTGKINRSTAKGGASQGYKDAEAKQLERQKQHEAEKAARTAPKPEAAQVRKPSL